jgi:hypothetical protein
MFDNDGGKVFCQIQCLTVLDSSLEGCHMPQYTVYAYVGIKHRRHPIVTVSSLPSDWFAIKQLVKESAIILFNDKKESEAILSIEQHLGGAFTMKWQKAGYSQKRLYYKRNIEFSCLFQFSPRTHQVKMTNIQFGPTLLFAGCLEDYRRIEKGIWKRPSSCIPKADADAIGGGNTAKRLLMQPSAVRNADYSRAPKLIYQEGPEQRMKWFSYDKIVNRRYMPKSQQLMEQNENENGEN